MSRRPRQCYAHGHAKGCRPGRPLCRGMRRVHPKRRVCRCSAYHYPHRDGSGACALGDTPAVVRESSSWKVAEAVALADDGEVSAAE